MRDKRKTSTSGIMGTALCLAIVYWFADSVYEYLMFDTNLKFMIDQSPLSFLDSFIRNVPTHAILNRLAFMTACLVSGWLLSIHVARVNRSQIALEISESNYKTYIKGAPDGVVVVNGKGYIVEMNDAANDLFSQIRDFKPDNSIIDICAEGQMHDLLMSIDKTGPEGRVELICKTSRKNSEPLHINISAVLLENRNYLLFCKDVTKRFLAEEEIKLFKAINDSACFGVLVANANPPLIEYANKFACDSIGYTEKELLGHPISIFLPPANRERFPRKWKEMLAEGHFKPLEVEHYHKDGTHKPVISNGIFIGNKETKEGKVAIIFLDIRERKSLLEQLHQAQKLESIGQLTGGIAHDFNNLLTPILGYSEMIMGDENLSPKDLKRITIIYEIGMKAKKLVSQLLAFGRKQMFTLDRINLNDIVDDQELLLRRLLRENITIIIDKDGSCPDIMGNQTQIQQIIMNLVVNSIDAMPSRGTLTINTASYLHTGEDDESRGKRFAKLSVSDTGIGMPKSIQENIFNPFFTTKEVGKGTGLGLSVVHGIVKQHNGHITVESTPGEGTTFRVFFPAASSNRHESSANEVSTTQFLKGEQKHPQ